VVLGMVERHARGVAIADMRMPGGNGITKETNRMDIASPYDRSADTWLKGALHVHSTNSDGDEAPHAVVRSYQRLGFDFVAITDHNAVPSPEDLAFKTKMVVIPSTEYRGAGADSEFGVVGIDEPLERVPGVEAYYRVAVESGGFVTFNHPTWHIHHWPVWWMLKLPRVHALEVYNAVGDRLPGASECTDKWDRLLTCGHQIWGTATDDAHTEEQRNRGWVMVNAERSRGAIVSALKAGRFYASSGVSIDSITLRGSRLAIDSDAEEIRFFADRGSMRHRVAGPTGSYTVRDDDIYVRAELYGRGASKAWTNPVYVETPRSRALAHEFRTWLAGQQRVLSEI
jgi:hypothetical protein